LEKSEGCLFVAFFDMVLENCEFLCYHIITVRRYPATYHLGEVSPCISRFLLIEECKFVLQRILCPDNKKGGLFYVHAKNKNGANI